MDASEIQQAAKAKVKAFLIEQVSKKIIEMDKDKSMFEDPSFYMELVSLNMTLKAIPAEKMFLKG